MQLLPPLPDDLVAVIRAHTKTPLGQWVKAVQQAIAALEAAGIPETIIADHFAALNLPARPEGHWTSQRVAATKLLDADKFSEPAPRTLPFSVFD